MAPLVQLIVAEVMALKPRCVRPSWSAVFACSARVCAAGWCRCCAAGWAPAGFELQATAPTLVHPPPGRRRFHVCLQQALAERNGNSAPEGEHDDRWGTAAAAALAGCRLLLEGCSGRRHAACDVAALMQCTRPHCRSLALDGWPDPEPARLPVLACPPPMQRGGCQGHGAAVCGSGRGLHRTHCGGRAAGARGGAMRVAALVYAGVQRLHNVLLWAAASPGSAAPRCRRRRRCIGALVRAAANAPTRCMRRLPRTRRQVSGPVEALLDVASHPDDSICSISFNFWHRLSRALTIGLHPEPLGGWAERRGGRGGEGRRATALGRQAAALGAPTSPPSPPPAARP